MLDVTKVNSEREFEPVERTVTMVMKGKGVRLLNETELSFLVRYSGAKPLGKFSYKNQIAVPLEESHLNYFWVGEGVHRVVVIQTSTCGGTNAPGTLAPIIEASGNPRNVSVVYSVGEPLLTRSVQQDITKYLPGTGWKVWHHCSSFGQLMSAARDDGANFSGSYAHLGMKGVDPKALEELADPSVRLNVLQSINPVWRGENYMHEFGPKAFTGVWLFDAGGLALHVTPEEVGPRKLNFVGAHVWALDGKYDIGELVNFMSPKKIDVVSINYPLSLKGVREARENAVDLRYISGASYR